MVRSLGVRECAVELVERDTLGGVDLILDPHTTVIFASLMALPSQCEALIARLGEQSWRFARLLVIFEAFSSSLAYKSDPASTRLTPSAYTPPILKAIKKFRRDLGIAEALETKNVRASIHFAFADSVHEAALFTRCFGDCAEANDTTGGAIWGPREWLDVEEQEVRIFLRRWLSYTDVIHCIGRARPGLRRRDERFCRINNPLSETPSSFLGFGDRNQST
jgi:hypothetical protein